MVNSRTKEAVAQFNMTTETPSADIVERLREHATDWDGRQMPDLEPAKGDPTAGTLREAATEVERLRAENAELQRKLDEAVKALNDIRQGSYDGLEVSHHSAHTCRLIAARALTSIRGEA